MSRLGPLHEQRMDAVMAELRGAGVCSVMDLGCGSGLLLARLLADARFLRVLGMDASAVALQVVRRHLLDGRVADEARLVLVHGSYTDGDPGLAGYEAATLVETIEHLEPGRLSRLEQAVFVRAAPGRVIVTTPNADYNPLYGLEPGGRRDPDHRFEWGRERFRAWAGGLARRNGYALRLAGIGEPDPALGAPTQMAVFSRQG